MTATAYDSLYENLKNRFTVINENSECTLGEYMLIKARESAQKASLPVAVSDKVANASMLQSVISYVNEKLTIKKAPAKDKTMKAFPFRTSFASLMSALLICSLVVTFGLIGTSAPVYEEESASGEYEMTETDIYEDEATDDFNYKASEY